MPEQVERDLVPRLPLLDRLALSDGAIQHVSSIRGGRIVRNDARLKASVLRDLAWLLNARESTDPELAAAHRNTEQLSPPRGTVVRFGLPDITNLDLQRDDEREALLRWIREAVQAFEPRLANVEVSLVETASAPGRTTFRIEAQLRVEAEFERLSFDGEVVWRTRELRLR